MFDFGFILGLEMADNLFRGERDVQIADKLFVPGQILCPDSIPGQIVDLPGPCKNVCPNGIKTIGRFQYKEYSSSNHVS